MAPSTTGNTTPTSTESAIRSGENAQGLNADWKDLGLFPIPRHLRYDPSKPPHFGITLNLVFAFASMFTAANIYYCQPLLIQFSETFKVEYSKVSNIPTLVQAGYAAGLLLITPLGDLVRRRQLILILVTITTLLTIGLAVTSNVVVFQVLTFFVGVATVTPQVLLPLAADLAPPERRASAISINLAGLLFGVLLARVLAGIIGQFASWRVVYYFAIGVQGLVLLACYAMIPDYPSKNDHLNYWQILWSMAKFAVTEPILIQACIINIGSSGCFSNFWVTLTFLLGGSPYNYNTLVIGLFGLIGMAGVAFSPIVGHWTDRLVPWYATLFSIILGLVSLSVQLGAGGINVAAVIIAAFGYDLARQSIQVSLSAAIFEISAEARSRINAVFILAFFIGQVMGTSVGTKVFLDYGWRAGAGLNVALMGFQFFILILRGPHVGRYTWFGYEGGFEYRRQHAAVGIDDSEGALQSDSTAEKATSSYPEKKPEDAGEKKENVGGSVVKVSEGSGGM